MQGPARFSQIFSKAVGIDDAPLAPPESSGEESTTRAKWGSDGSTSRRSTQPCFSASSRASSSSTTAWSNAGRGPAQRVPT